MKLIRFGKAGKMILLGEDSKSAKWYVIGDGVKQYLGSYKEGDNITIKSEKQNGTDVLTFIAKADGSSVPADNSAPASRPAYQPKPAGSYGQSPEVQESIKRQAIGNMTSRSMCGLQDLTTQNIEEITRKQYKVFTELVG